MCSSKTSKDGLVFFSILKQKQKLESAEKKKMYHKKKWRCENNYQVIYMQIYCVKLLCI